MAEFHSSENATRQISTVRLVYGEDSLSQDPAWLQNIDWCTKLVLELKENQLLSGYDAQKEQEAFEMEAAGFAAYDDDYEEDEE